VGAKDYDQLSAVGGGLHNALDFGWFSFFATPLFLALRFLYHYVGNFGLAIIMLTITVRSLLLVFTIPSMKGMQKMQEIAPKIEKIRKEIKDSQEQNKEIMALYSREGVNPLQSCLPMLLQIPIFIALYNVLFVAIELRHAHFLFWLSDLSAPDPYKIMPILMGITMLFQQLVSPAAGLDKAQAAMMKWMMPIFLVGISWSFPSGLVLYWTTSNIFTVGQQLALMKLGIIKSPQSSQSKNNASDKKQSKRRKK
jgi:YidC/Oxa1 family membrane protein insertase